jgi:GTPase SAR1 family protein
MSNKNALTHFPVHSLLRAKDWQTRPEYDQVCQWWNSGGNGVCALIGMGGAGKTAIAEQFLHSLPGLFPNAARTTKQSQKLRVPSSVFIYSFYDDDKPANFLESLQMWLEGDARPKDQLSITQIKFLIRSTHGLIVLDGLEKLQEGNDRGFGKLISPQVRDLLDHIASGAGSKLGVLLTSRFPLTDLRDSDRRFYHAITIDRIGIEAGMQLLRDRGVSGSDSQLTKIVHDCGQHALTIDLAAGFISEFGDGNPNTGRLSSKGCIIQKEHNESSSCSLE